MNTWRNRHTISAKSTHDLGLSASDEIDTRSRLSQTYEIGSKRIASTHLQLISNDHTGLKLSLSFPQATLSKLQYQLSIKETNYR